jgi:hypothetical protein
MRIADDLRKKVVFFGLPDASEPSGVTCVGTGFLLAYDGGGYLVTNGHLARPLEQIPFLIRVNKKGGEAVNIHVDGMRWFHHKDPSVDISVAHVWLPPLAGLECSYIECESFVLDEETFKLGNIGIANATYTTGLFRLMSGQKRNLPIVHQGSIAMVPGDEMIPVQDWLAPVGVKRTRYVEGYLVESQSLSGLSGSPVWVRPDYEIAGPPRTRAGAGGLILLGVWQGAWDAPPDEVLAVEHGKEVRVPVGMGVVVPSHKILEVLDMPEVKAKRDEEKHQREAIVSVKVDAVLPVSPPASGANPSHREDFARLLGTAARKSRKDD